MKRTIWGLVIVGLILLPFYLFTLQTIPNGSDHLTMIDVGETQVVLNVWGTLHATGYPLYVMLSAALVTLLKMVGVSAATAPAVTSLVWGGLALAVIYTLAVVLTGRVLPAAIMVVVFGLTRMVWLHHVIAEIYTFGLLLTALLLLVALWKKPMRERIYWLGLLGGIGVGHHRAVVMLAPALIYAVWPVLVTVKQSTGRSNASPLLQHLSKQLIISLLIGLAGLVPYVYLPLREQAGAAWVYGEPGTLAGLWDQFSGREAARFIGAPVSLIENFNKVNTALLADVTLPGLVIGLVGLVLAARTLRHRRATVTLMLAGGVSYGFHGLFYSDILAALILQITLSIAFGWLFVIDWLLVRAIQAVGDFQFQVPVWVRGYVVGTAGLLALLLIAQNLLWIRGLTHDTTGWRTIGTAKQIEPGSMLMIPWGTRHFAVGFARDVLGELPGVTLVDHKADLQAPLLTLADTFYAYPVSWWETQWGVTVYLQAAAPGLVEIVTEPEINLAQNLRVTVVEQEIICEADRLVLKIVWAAGETPQQDLSVFVHLLDAQGHILAQADQTAPVFGWRPLTTWAAGEIVRDVYTLPRRADATHIRYGLYRQLDTGAFQNEYEYEMTPTC